MDSAQLTRAGPRAHHKKERRMFSASDDTAMMKQVQATHAPDGREVDVKPILFIIDDILLHTTASSPTHEKGEQVEQTLVEKSTTDLTELDHMLDTLAFIIHKISCELSCKCSGGGDAHATTMVILNNLSSYSWDAKVVLTLAAFAVNFGEFWLVALLGNANPLAKYVALLKQLPDILGNSNNLRPQFDALVKLVKAVIGVTKTVVEFKELPPQYISEEEPPLSIANAYIPIAAYWTIRSIVASATQIATLVGMRNDYYISSTTEAWELSSLEHKVSNIHEHLKNQLALCHRHIGDKRHMETYENIVRAFETTPHPDNSRILKLLLSYAREGKEDLYSLVECQTNTRVSIEILKRKQVLLLISDLDISTEEIMILDHLHKESRSRPEFQYEVVWMPIVDRLSWNVETGKQKFEQLLKMMSWYSFHHPLYIDPAVIKYIKEVWHFSKRVIVVSLDPQGRVSSQNALHMIWIWGNLAYPFTREKEEQLWKGETWSLEILVDGIDPTVLEWIAEGKYVCLYGGEDLEWIRKFTYAVKSVVAEAGIKLEMLYVGKSNAKERMQKMISTFNLEQFSYFWPNLTSIWFFWARLESMLYSKIQHDKNAEHYDHITQEVMTLLSYDGSDQGWAIFSKGLDMARAKGPTAQQLLDDYPKWQGEAEKEGFLNAINSYLQQLHTPHHCNRLILPGNTGGIPERVVCAECGRQMEKYFMYRCCVE